MVQSYSEEQIDTCCSSLGLHYRWYTGMLQYRNDVIGVSADINIQYGFPCRYVYDDTIQTFSIAYIGAVDYKIINDEIYRCSAQFGYGFSRNMIVGDDINLYSVSRYDYIEIIGNTYQNYYRLFDTTGINNGYTYNFKSTLDRNTGIWHFYLDDDEVYTSLVLADDYWKQHVCERIDIMGEITHFETDMPGEYLNECIFGGCKYISSDGGFHNIVELPTDHIENKFQDEWGFLRQETSYGDMILIWDKNRQPTYK